MALRCTVCYGTRRVIKWGQVIDLHTIFRVANDAAGVQGFSIPRSNRVPSDGLGETIGQELRLRASDILRSNNRHVPCATTVSVLLGARGSSEWPQGQVRGYHDRSGRRKGNDDPGTWVMWLIPSRKPLQWLPYLIRVTCNPAHLSKPTVIVLWGDAD